MKKNILFFVIMLAFISFNCKASYVEEEKENKKEHQEKEIIKKSSLVEEEEFLKEISLVKKSPLVEKTELLAEKLGFVCKIYHHEKSGSSSEMASDALGVDPGSIIKSLYIKDSAGNKLAVILRGTDKLDTSALKKVWDEQFPDSPLKKISFANAKALDSDLGYLPGGVPPIVFCLKGIPTFVDADVYGLDVVIGSGGTEFDAMQFNPKQLISVTKYFLANLKQ